MLFILIVLIIIILLLSTLVYSNDNNNINEFSKLLSSLLIKLNNDTNTEDINNFIPSLTSLLSSSLNEIDIKDDIKDYIINKKFDNYPPLWDNVKELNKDNFKIDSNGALIIDPWDYLHRQALYKHLIYTLNDCIWLTDNDNDIQYPGNIIWGLALQHGWQYRSGRLLNNGTMIDKNAWWGGMNYYLSIIPYFGAMKNKMVPDISIDYTSDKFCNSIESCSDVLKPWEDFFNVLDTDIKECKNSNGRRTLEFHTPLVDRLDFNLSSNMESLLGSLWTAHLHSINYAKPLFVNQLQMMSKPEALFGNSWAQLVDLIAESRLPCNFTLTNILQTVLPSRLLIDSDEAPKIQDLTRLQNRAIVIIDSINILNEKFHGLIEKTWRRMMCSEEGRALGREMITLGMYRIPVIIEDGIALMKLTILNFPQKDCN
jgi:hypothetical protein